jgi:hypothetical protein
MSSFEEIFNSCVEDLKRGESKDTVKKKICINLIKEPTVNEIMDLVEEKVKYDRECERIRSDDEHYKEALDLNDNLFKSHLVHTDQGVEEYVDKYDRRINNGLHFIKNDLELMFKILGSCH